MREFLRHKSAIVTRTIDELIGHRGQRILKTGSWALISKICAAINLFVCVPFVLEGLGPNYFGAWATVVSIVTLTNFLDFGIGNGALNQIASAVGENNLKVIPAIIRSTYQFAMRISLCIILFLVVAVFIPWYKVLGLTQSDSLLSLISVTIVIVSVAINIPLGLSIKFQLGLGNGGTGYRWLAAGQIATIAVVILASKYNANLALLVAASTLTPLAGLIFNSISVHKMHGVKKDQELISSNDLPLLMSQGRQFFYLQLLAAFAFSVDLLFIATINGSNSAGSFSIIQRIFSIIPIFSALIWTALWPIYRSSMASGDYKWAIKTLKYSIIGLLFISSSLGIIFALFIEKITIAWIGHAITYNPVLVWSFTGWVIIESIGASISIFLNAAGVIKFQLLTFGLFAITSVIAKYFLLTFLGPDYIVLSTILFYIGLNLIPLAVFLPRIIKNIKSGNKGSILSSSL